MPYYPCYLALEKFHSINIYEDKKLYVQLKLEKIEQQTEPELQDTVRTLADQYANWDMFFKEIIAIRRDPLNALKEYLILFLPTLARQVFDNIDVSDEPIELKSKVHLLKIILYLVKIPKLIKSQADIDGLLLALIELNKQLNHLYDEIFSPEFAANASESFFLNMAPLTKKLEPIDKLLKAIIETISSSKLEEQQKQKYKQARKNFENACAHLNKLKPLGGKNRN